MQSIDPSNGASLARYEPDSSKELNDTIERAALAFEAWRRTSFDERASCMRAAAEVLRAGEAQHAELMAREMGKPVAAGREELRKCAWVCEHYAEHGAAMLEPRAVRSDAGKSWIAYQPLGPVLGVMPWNFPFWQVFRFAVPTLMAGNVALLKHASNVTGCGIEIEHVFAEAGFPEGVFATLLAPSDMVDAILAHPAIRAVSVTGSTRAGAAVAAQAGALLKKSVLELGGSDAYAVLSDAEVERAADVAVMSRMLNAGQSCIAAKRFIVVRGVREAFEQRVLERMQAYAMGSPLLEGTQLGPLAREDLREALHRQVTDSIDRGARLLLGGEIPDKSGWWYPPTVLSEVGPGMPAYDEETFGPVAAIIEAADDDDAIRIANDSSYGLGAAVFTRDAERGARIAEQQLEAGSCFVNAHVRSDPRLPFGGVKSSGYGRELSEVGIREFVNIKTVWVA